MDAKRNKREKIEFRGPFIELNYPMVDVKGPWRELNGHRMELRSRQSAPKRSK